MSSGAMSKGLVRKVMALLCVLIGERLDLLLGADYVRNGIIIAFCVNELLSIIENMGLMGIPIPEPLKNAIDLLKSKSEPPSKTDT